jgi:hypothetical protein
VTGLPVPVAVWPPSAGSLWSVAVTVYPLPLPRSRSSGTAVAGPFTARTPIIARHRPAYRQRRKILRETSAPEPWEHVVNLCLRALTGEG